MRHATLISFLFLCYFYVQGQTIQPAPPDKAVIYFVRPSSLGFAINFSYFDSTQLIGKFNGPAYIRYACKAGRHIFWARSENKNFVEADVEAGKIYFIEAIVNMGAIKAAVRLDPLDPDDQKRMKSVLKLIAKEPSESFSDDELRAQEKKMEAIITRGLEKYNADKQKGRTLARLNKDMYYKK